MDFVTDAIRIGIIGDFNPEFRSHHATNDSLQHAARKLQLKVESVLDPHARFARAVRRPPLSIPSMACGPRRAVPTKVSTAC